VLHAHNIQQHDHETGDSHAVFLTDHSVHRFIYYSEVTCFIAFLCTQFTIDNKNNMHKPIAITVLYSRVEIQFALSFTFTREWRDRTVTLHSRAV